jgi:CRP/FNR family cyclic AMP-dependent transcriptional regulator
MRAEQAAALLARTELFADLDPAALLRLGDRAVKRSFRKGQLIFHQGDLGDSMFVVADGLVKVFVISEEGNEMVLVTLGPQETFGDLAVIDGGRRSASAQALEATTLIALTRSAVLEIMAEQPLLAESLLRALAAVARRLTEQTSDLVFLDLPGRVAKLLLALAEDRGEDHGEEVVLDTHMTQADLASMVGGSRQSVNQILRSFQGRGFLEFRGREVVLKRRDQLRRRAATWR